MPSFRVLVVEDYEPFRRVIRSIVKPRREFAIVHEASDGLEAIRKAEESQPDLVLLDIGLPMLNGLEAAQGIRSVAPQAKLLFVSQESSPDIIRETFRAGGQAYVHKARVLNDLVLAIEVVLSGKQFASGTLKFSTNAITRPHRHDVLFCSDDGVLVDALSEFILDALRADKVTIAVVTEAHQESLFHKICMMGVDLKAAMERGSYVTLSPGDLLSMFMVGDGPDEERFATAADFLIRTAAERTPGERRQVVACGECAPALWRQDKVEATIRLERLLDKLASSHQVDIFCTYPSLSGQEDGAALRSLCEDHTAVHSQ